MVPVRVHAENRPLASGRVRGVNHPSRGGAGPDERPRVAIVSHSAYIGAETLLVRLLSVLDRERVDPHVLLPDEGPLRGEIERLGVPVDVVPTRWWLPATHWSASQFREQFDGFERRVANLEAWLSARRIDLVHTNTLVTLEGAIAAARVERPHVWHSRGLFLPGSPAYDFLGPASTYAIVDRLSDTVACVSRAVAEEAGAFCHHASISVVYDGLDLEILRAEPPLSGGSFRERFGIPEGVRTLACVGGIQRNKGQLDLVEAMARLPLDFSDLTLLLFGAESDAGYCTRVREAVDQAGLLSRVRFIGHVPDVVRCLPLVDLVVHPSRSEGFGLSVLEAMAMGCPVLAARSGGPEELIEHEVSGVLVPPGDPGALAAGIVRLLSNPELGRRLGLAASSRAERFSLAATGPETLGIYLAAIARHAASGDCHRVARAAIAATINQWVVRHFGQFADRMVR